MADKKPQPKDQDQELTDEQLKKVAGGAGRGDASGFGDGTTTSSGSTGDTGSTGTGRGGASGF